MRRIAAAVFVIAAGLLVTEGAQAFVSPRWRAREASPQNAMVGRWQVVGGRHKSGHDVDLDLEIEIDRDTIRVTETGASAVMKWSYVGQEGDIVTISVEDEKGRKHAVDVLVENRDALTFYVVDDEGDDEEVLRLERTL